MRHGSLLLFLVLLALLLPQYGCIPDGSPPTGSDGECKQDGVCDKAKESCQSCPWDCSCCHAYRVVGNGQVTQPGYAEGRPDNRFAQMSGMSVLVLDMGQGIQNQVGSDFNLIGTVQSGSATSITVSVKNNLPHEGGTWHQVGIWHSGATGSTGFDVGSVPFSPPSFSSIKLESTGGTVAKVDAAESINCKK